MPTYPSLIITKSCLPFFSSKTTEIEHIPNHSSGLCVEPDLWDSWSFHLPTGAVRAGEFVSTCEGVDAVDPPVLEDHHGPLPHNKTLFLGYAFLLTMATPSDKLVNRQKTSDGPAGSSEEEEGEVNLTHHIFKWNALALGKGMDFVWSGIGVSVFLLLINPLQKGDNCQSLREFTTWNVANISDDHKAVQQNKKGMTEGSADSEYITSVI